MPGEMFHEAVINILFKKLKKKKKKKKKNGRPMTLDGNLSPFL